VVIANEDNFPIIGFQGLNFSDYPEFIGDHELFEAENVLLHKDGSLRKRYPVQQFTDLEASEGVYNAINFLGQLVLLDGLDADTYTFVYLPVAGLDTVYYLHDDESTYTEITDLSDEIVWSGCQYDDKFYFACESGVFEWEPTGNTATLIADSPVSIRKIITFRERLFGIVGDRLYYTDPLDVAVWNTILISAGDGNDCLGLTAYADKLVIFKNSTIWALYFADDPLYWYVRKIYEGAGTLGPKAVCTTEGLIYFADRNGYWVTDTVTFNKLHDLESSEVLTEGPPSVAIYGAFVSRYKDWIIFRNDWYGKTHAYRMKSPKGFTELTFDAGAPKDVFFEQVIFDSASQWLLALGSKLYKFVDYETVAGESDPPVEEVPMTISTREFDFSRISRTKRMKYATILFGGPVDGVQYEWVVDSGLVTTASEVVDVDATGMSNRSIKIKGANFNRTAQLKLAETSSKLVTFFGFNAMLQLHRQQTFKNDLGE
jgi:hypothetical protein